MYKSKHKLYFVYQNMIHRCYKKTNINFKLYGGRGIKVCDRWRNDFWNFVEDMVFRPEGYQLDRIDNNGNYEPNNCRWTSCKENLQNTRRSKTWYIKGKTFNSCTDAARYFNVDHKTIQVWVSGRTYKNRKTVTRPRKDCYAIKRYK